MQKRLMTAVTAVALVGGLAACGGGGGAAGSGGSGGSGGGAGGGATEAITMGFSQVGAESGWRTANTKSIQEAAAAAGVDLKFSDAQQKQENQITAIRSFIQQQVDVIAFSPVVRTGWDAVLLEAKAGEHPGDPHRPRGRHPGDRRLQDLPRRRLRRRGPAGRAVGGQQYAGRRTGPVNIVAARRAPPAPTRRSTASKGFAEVIAANPNLQGHRLADRRFHPVRRQAGDGGLPEGQPEDRRACSRRTTTWVSARSRPSRPPAQARARTSRSSPSTRQATGCRRSPTASSTSSWSATRCSARN